MRRFITRARVVRCVVAIASLLGPFREDGCVFRDWNRARSIHRRGEHRHARELRLPVRRILHAVPALHRGGLRAPVVALPARLRRVLRGAPADHRVGHSRRDVPVVKDFIEERRSTKRRAPARQAMQKAPESTLPRIEAGRLRACIGDYVSRNHRCCLGAISTAARLAALHCCNVTDEPRPPR